MNLPKVKTILAFLYSNGWKLGKETKTHFIVMPPDGFDESGGFNFYIPKHENMLGYKDVIKDIVGSIAEIFEEGEEDMIRFLSQDIQTIKENAEIGARMAAFAA